MQRCLRLYNSTTFPPFKAFPHAIPLLENYTDTRAYSSLKSQLKPCFGALNLKCGPPLYALSQKVLSNYKL